MGRWRGASAPALVLFALAPGFLTSREDFPAPLPAAWSSRQFHAGPFFHRGRFLQRFCL